MAIKTYPSKKAKYFVIVHKKYIHEKYLNCQESNPRICSFGGLGYFSTNKKDAIALKKDLEKRHGHTCTYTIHIWNPIN